MRALTIFVIAAVLTGCSQPTAGGFLASGAPLFTRADAAPRLRDGIWALVRDDCSFDGSRPTAEWPDCATPRLVAQGRMADLTASDQPTISFPYILAAGPPPVLQQDLTSGEYPLFVYEVALPLATDGEGRVTSLYREPLPCYYERGTERSAVINESTLVANSAGDTGEPVAGNNVSVPPPPEAAPGPAPKMLPGLSEGGPFGCTTDRSYVAFSVARVVAEAASQEVANFRWVRDGTR